MREYHVIADWFSTDRSRSAGVAEALAVAATLPARVRILDAGCGNGRAGRRGASQSQPRPVCEAHAHHVPSDIDFCAAHVTPAGGEKQAPTRARVAVQRFAKLTCAFYGAMSPQRSSQSSPSPA